jgi:putative molybdopterin biosynthesis protein
MRSIETLGSLERLKILADPRRLEILRLLMASPATLTQLARRLRQSPAWIRHHLKRLELADLIELSEIRITGRSTEKYYRARAGALLMEQLVLPRTRMPVVVFSGSHDLAFQHIADRLGSRRCFLSLHVGSLNGLMNLRQGVCHLSGAHLLDESGEYNTPFVRHFFPDGDVELVTLAHRTQGLMLAPGNPKSIRGIRDLARPGIRFVNRNRGSGTRLWVERELSRSGVQPRSVRGYASEVATHSDAASLIHTGRADVSLGLQAAAFQHDLGFLPIFEERYDLALKRQDQRLLAPVLDFIQTAGFRSSLARMTGYNTAHSGEQIHM